MIFKKIKKFISKRSDMSLLLFLISIMFGVLLIFEFLNYSKYVSLVSKESLEFSQNFYINSILQFSSSKHSYGINTIIYSIIMFSTLYNMVGYLYNKSEFIFISTGLYVILACISIYLFEVSGIILVLSLLILNLMSYFGQVKLENKSKKRLAK